MPDFLTRRNGTWHFARRVPIEFAKLDHRGVVKHSTRIKIVHDRAGYAAAISGKLKLVPDKNGREALKADYEQMVDAGILLGDAEEFDELMDLCSDLESRANSK
jgi:hypothetical protein